MKTNINKNSKFSIILILLVIFLSLNLSIVFVSAIDMPADKILDFYHTRFYQSKVKLTSESSWEKSEVFKDLEPKIEIYDPIKQKNVKVQSAINIENDGFMVFKNKMRDGGKVYIKTKNGEVKLIAAFNSDFYCPGGLTSSCIYSREGNLLYNYKVNNIEAEEYSKVKENKRYMGECPEKNIEQIRNSKNLFCGEEETKVELKAGDVVYFKGEDYLYETGGTGLEIWGYKTPCISDEECNDDNPYTYDECVAYGEEGYCENTEISCIENNDCGTPEFILGEFCSENNVFKIFQTPICENPGTKESKCKISQEPKIFKDCGENDCGEWSENYCKNGDVYHKQECFDKGCEDGKCYSDEKIKEDKIKECHDKGCEDGKCIGDDSMCTIDSECGQEDVLDVCKNDGNLYTLTINPKCYEGICSSEENFQLKQECENGCSGGKCIKQNQEITCSSNTDCGVDSWLDQAFCENNNVFDNFMSYTCINPGTTESQCVSLSEILLKQDCGQESSGENYCSEGNVVRDKIVPKCQEGECNSENILEIVEECENGCENAQCKEEVIGDPDDNSEGNIDNNVDDGVDDNVDNNIENNVKNNKKDVIYVKAIQKQQDTEQNINENTEKIVLSQDNAKKKYNINILPLIFLIGIVILIVIIFLKLIIS